MQIDFQELFIRLAHVTSKEVNTNITDTLKHCIFKNFPLPLSHTWL